MAGFRITNFLRPAKVNTLKLYDSIENLPILRFFQIMKSEDLSLLIWENPQNLIPSKELLQQIWNEISDQYYQEANPRKYKEKLREAIKVETSKNRIVLLSSIRSLKALGDESADEYMKQEGVNENNIESRINTEKTKLQLLIAQLKKEEKESGDRGEMNFWKTIATIERGLNRSLDVEKITVAHWIAIVNDLKEHYNQVNNGSRKNNKGRHN